MSTVAAGVQKVRSSNGGYAFIMESSFADFWINKPPCDLMTVGPRLNSNEYGLAVRKGDPMKDRINVILTVSIYIFKLSMVIKRK